MAVFAPAGSHADADSLTPLNQGPVAGAGLPPAFRERIGITSPWRLAVSKITMLDRGECLTC